jgi:hypothetical protein
VRFAQVLWNDQIKALTLRFVCGVAKQYCCGTVPAADVAILVCLDDGIGGLFQYQIPQLGLRLAIFVSHDGLHEWRAGHA